MISWVMWLILVLIILCAVCFVVLKKKYKRPTDYYSLFIIGVMWLPLGILMLIVNREAGIGFLFSILGLVYLVIGLIHKKDWKKNRKTWNQLSDKRKKFKIILLIILGIILLVGFLFFYLSRRGLI